MDEVAESMDVLRAGAWGCSGLVDRDAGGMAAGGAGGEVAASDGKGAEGLRSWACAEGVAGRKPPRGGIRGVEGGDAGRRPARRHGGREERAGRGGRAGGRRAGEGGGGGERVRVGAWQTAAALALSTEGVGAGAGARGGRGGVHVAAAWLRLHRWA